MEPRKPTATTSDVVAADELAEAIARAEKAEWQMAALREVASQVLADGFESCYDGSPVVCVDVELVSALEKCRQDTAAAAEAYEQRIRAAARREVLEALSRILDCDWAEKKSELARWTGSGFIAGETHPSDMAAKGDLYGFLCRLAGCVISGKEANSFVSEQLAALDAGPGQ